MGLMGNQVACMTFGLLSHRGQSVRASAPALQELGAQAWAAPSGSEQ
jgi:hypothetical protein